MQIIVLVVNGLSFRIHQVKKGKIKYEAAKARSRALQTSSTSPTISLAP